MGIHRRNDVVFKGSNLESRKLFEIILSRLSHWSWSRAKWPEAIASSANLISFPHYFRLLNIGKDRKPQSYWLPPPPGVLKFNTNGAMAGSHDKVCTGGWLRNEFNKCLLYFSKSAALVDPTTTELLASL
ncbi:hypothetical protein V6N13_033632 [Hibiscus sabdariffa]